MIAVWFWRLDQPAPIAERLAACLSAEEIARAGRFLRAGDGARFRAARGGLRQLLAREIGADPSRLAFAQTQWGKPELAGPEAGRVNFNLSHTARGSMALAALAVSRDCEVGIDVEGIGRMETDVSRGFTEAERAELQQGAETDWPLRFFQIWTAKEAVLKAVGTGFAHGLDAVCVARKGGRRVPQWLGSRVEGPAQIAIEEFSVGADLVGALAAVGRDGPLGLDVRCEHEFAQ